MEQIERIRQMEERFDRVWKAVHKLNEAMEEFDGSQESIRELEEYYEGGLWRKDFEDDEKGKIPRNLKRGVLSEDGLFDLFLEIDAIRELCGKSSGND